MHLKTVSKKLEEELVQFITASTKCTYEDELMCNTKFYRIRKKIRNDTTKTGNDATQVLDINIDKLQDNYSLITWWRSEIYADNRIDLDYLPKCVLALLAIVHRKAYEFYKEV